MAKNETKKFDFIDLFAGIGGFHHALEELGGNCVLASDLDKTCRLVYQATWPEHPADALIGDVRSLTQNEDGSDRSLREIARLVPDHDVLCGGFPCQPFSKSGVQQGVLDQTRGTLFFDIMEIAKAKQPRYIILENVRNLAGPRHAETFRTIIESLRECGYRVATEPVIFSPHLLPPELGGSPQHRERVFILAERVGVSAKDKTLDLGILNKPIEGWEPSRWSVEEFLQDDAEIADLEKYRLNAEDEAALHAWNAFIKGIPDESLPGFPIWVDSFKSRPVYPAEAPEWKKDFIKKNSDFYKKHKLFIDDWLTKTWISGKDFRVTDFTLSRRKFEWQARNAQPKRKGRDLWKLAIQFRPSGVRVKALTYLPTLVAITQTSYIGPRRRFLTPIEAGRIQGFPDTVFPNAKVDDKHAYKQAGNAVHVGVVKHMARKLFTETKSGWL